MRERVMLLENGLTLKANQTDFEVSMNKLNNQINMTNNIRDLVERVQDMSTKNMQDLGYFLNKIESLSATVVTMKEALETLSAMKQDNIIDITQFVENIATTAADGKTDHFFSRSLASFLFKEKTNKKTRFFSANRILSICTKCQRIFAWIGENSIDPERRR